MDEMVLLYNTIDYLEGNTQEDIDAGFNRIKLVISNEISSDDKKEELFDYLQKRKSTLIKILNENYEG